MGNSLSFKHVWLNKDACCLYNFIKIFSSFLRSILFSGWNWWINLPKLSRALSDNFGKFIHQFKSKTKTLFRKLECILIKLYRQNLSLLFNQSYIYIYIYIYIKFGLGNFEGFSKSSLEIFRYLFLWRCRCNILKDYSFCWNKCYYKEWVTFKGLFCVIWTAINRLSTIWKSDLTDKMKRSFFQAAVTSILLYGCTTWTLTKRLEKKLDGNYTRMLRAILNKSWQQHPTRHQLYGHLPPITKTIQVRRTRHTGHCWRSRDELIRDVLLWIPTHGRAKAGRPARTYIQQLCEDTGCCPEDLPRAMNDRVEWRERVRDIRAASTIWWWWWYIYILGFTSP